MRERLRELAAQRRGPHRRRGGGTGSRRPQHPDAGFAHLAHAWAAGDGLADLLEDELLSGGDFVRNVKQLIDLLRGIGDVAPVPATAAKPDRPPRPSTAAWCRRRPRSRWRKPLRPTTVSRGRPVTIRKGEPWGEPGVLPADGVVGPLRRRGPRRGDSGPRAGEHRRPSGLLGGDLCRALAGTGDEARLRDAGTVVPVDLAAVLVDGRLHWFVAHLIARRGWWRGPLVAAMNAQHLGPWDVAPRGHPNDGRLDVFEADLGLGDRWKARRRARHRARTCPTRASPSGTSPPCSWSSAPARKVWLDGEPLGSGPQPGAPGRARRPDLRRLAGCCSTVPRWWSAPPWWSARTDPGRRRPLSFEFRLPACVADLEVGEDRRALGASNSANQESPSVFESDLVPNSRACTRTTGHPAARVGERAR